MKRRVFIAINLPEKIKKQLNEFREKFDYLPVRWTKEDSLHLTLVFIGYVSDEQMLEICRVSREVAGRLEPFIINFRKILLGPPGKAPRMIWVEGEASQELTNLRDLLENALLEADSGLSRKEFRAIRPHITLARIKTDRWREIEPAPNINEEFQVKVSVDSIEVMESDLKNDGAEYTILESCPIEKN